MDEAEFNACTDPQAMLSFLLASGTLSGRKARLFAAACCRRVWHLLVDRATRDALAVAELVVEGLADEPALARAEAQAEAAYESTRPAAEEASRRAGERARRGETGCVAGEALAVRWAAGAVAGACRADAAEASRRAAHGVSMAVLAATAPWGPGRAEFDARWAADDGENAAVLRDLVGPLPFRSIEIEASWRTPAVLALANATYHERRFEDLPILADALEEAGCQDQAILDHLRGPGPHVRGCWPLDLILGRA
jgi:hypothetical protein